VPRTTPVPLKDRNQEPLRNAPCRAVLPITAMQALSAMASPRICAGNVKGPKALRIAGLTLSKY